MWSQQLFDMLYEAMNNGGILTTYCAKGVVRRMLQASGFIVERLAGPPGGRRIKMRATKQKKQKLRKRHIDRAKIIRLCIGCNSKNGKNGDENEKPSSAVTIKTQRYLTEAIAGDKFDVVSIVPKGSSPESYDPTPQQLVSFANSKAYLRIGHIGFETIWMDRLLDTTPHIQVFDTSEDVNLIYEEHDHDHGQAGHLCGNGVEPHIWNSTENAYIIARNTYKALCQLDKENENY